MVIRLESPPIIQSFGISPINYENLHLAQFDEHLFLALRG